MFVLPFWKKILFSVQKREFGCCGFLTVNDVNKMLIL